eukprot:Rhum_TRINITY_DN15428_c6_g2::Rhum_TRINITY_DN15428_c6_g2_i3::g.155779::m.155779
MVFVSGGQKRAKGLLHEDWGEGGRVVVKAPPSLELTRKLLNCLQPPVQPLQRRLHVFSSGPVCGVEGQHLQAQLLDVVAVVAALADAALQCGTQLVGVPFPVCRAEDERIAVALKHRIRRQRKQHVQDDAQAEDVHGRLTLLSGDGLRRHVLQRALPVRNAGAAPRVKVNQHTLRLVLRKQHVARLDVAVQHGTGAARQGERVQVLQSARNLLDEVDHRTLRDGGSRLGDVLLQIALLVHGHANDDLLRAGHLDLEVPDDVRVRHCSHELQGPHFHLFLLSRRFTLQLLHHELLCAVPRLSLEQGSLPAGDDFAQDPVVVHLLFARQAAAPPVRVVLHHVVVLLRQRNRRLQYGLRHRVSISPVRALQGVASPPGRVALLHPVLREPFLQRQRYCLSQHCIVHLIVLHGCPCRVFYADGELLPATRKACVYGSQ